MKGAAEDARKYLGTAQNNLINATGIAHDAAGNILRDAYGNARTDLAGGYDAASGAIRGGASGALGHLDESARAAAGRLAATRDEFAGANAFTPLSDLGLRYGAGARLYADALGVNGAEGNARAAGAFQAGPGYDFALKQGIDAINRRAAAAGMLAGGNANRSAIDYATGLANKEYGGWLDRLGGFNNLELGATTGAAQGNASTAKSLADLGLAEANLLDNAGRAKAGVATGEGTSLADIARAFYTAQGGLDTAEGGALAGNIADANKSGIGIGLNIAPQIAGTYKDEANAEIAGSKMFWDTLKDAAQIALRAGGVGGYGRAAGRSGGGTS